MQTHELLTGLQSELRREPAPRAGKRVERVRLAPRSVQREHQRTPQTLLERVRRHAATRARPRAHRPHRPRGQLRSEATAPEAASPREPGATGRRFPRRRRRRAARRGAARGPDRAAPAPDRGPIWPGPPMRRTAGSRARSSRRAASTRRPRVGRGRRAGPGALTSERATPRPRSPADAPPTARRSTGHARAELRRLIKSNASSERCRPLGSGTDSPSRSRMSGPRTPNRQTSSATDRSVQPGSPGFGREQPRWRRVAVSLYSCARWRRSRRPRSQVRRPDGSARRRR